MELVDGVRLDLVWLPDHRLGFRCTHMAGSVNKTAPALAGEMYNGLEVWRRMYLEVNGGRTRLLLVVFVNL